MYYQLTKLLFSFYSSSQKERVLSIFKRQLAVPLLGTETFFLMTIFTLGFCPGREGGKGRGVGGRSTQVYTAMGRYTTTSQKVECRCLVYNVYEDCQKRTQSQHTGGLKTWTCRGGNDCSRRKINLETCV